MSFDAGALIFRLQTMGAQAFQSDLDQADKAIEKAGKSSKETAKATEEMGKQQDTARPKVKTLGQELTGLSETGRAASKAIGTSMLGAGAAITAITALSIKSAIDWESAWTGVTKTVDGTPEQLAQVEDGLRGLAKELPSTHTELAAVAEAAGQLGVKRQDIVSFTRTMVDLGQTTNLSADEAATAIAQLSNVMQTAPKDVGRLGSALVALGNDGASTERDILNMGQRIAGAGKVIGLTEGEVLGFANALASVGVDAEAGGTAISKVMTDIAKSVSSGGKDLDTFARVAGMSAKDFSAAFKKDPAEAIAAFVKGLGQVNKSGGDVFMTLQQLGQTDARVSQALLLLANSGDLLTESLETGNKAFEDNNALAEEAAKRYETVQSKIAVAGNSINDAAISFGSVFLPAVADAAKGVADFAQGLSEVPEPIQGMIGGLGGIAGGALLVGGATLSAIPRILEFRDSLKDMNDTMPKTVGLLKYLGVGLAIGAAAAAGTTALIAWRDNAEDATVTSEQLRNALLTAADAGDLFAKTLTLKGADITNDIAPFTDSVEDFGNTARQVSGYSDDLWGEFTKLLSFDYSKMKDFSEGWSKLGKEMGALVDSGDMTTVSGQLAQIQDQAKLTDDEMYGLIKSSPELLDAFTSQATAAGLAADKQTILNLALAEGPEPTQKNADALAELSGKAVDAGFDIDELANKILEFGSAALDTREATRDFQQAVDEAAEAVAANGATLDISTKQGRDNEASLDAIAAAAKRQAAAVLEQTGSQHEASAALAVGREELIKALAQYGITGDAAQDYADTLGLIPGDVSTVVSVETESAEQKFRTFVSSISGQTVSIGIYGETYVDGKPRGYMADGGVVEFYARGGVRDEHHVAQIAAAGSMRVWAEPETGGEAYIPLSAAKRGRSTAILENVAQRFGFQLVPGNASSHADGSVSDSPSGGATHSHQWTVYTNDPESLYQGFVRRTENAGV